MIRSLAINNEVEVISVRPFSHRFCKAKKLEEENKKEGNITWHYIPIRGNRLTRPFYIKNAAKKALKSLDLTNAIFLSDTINPNVITNANRAHKKYHNPLCGIITDSPSNISGTGRSYTLYLLKQGQHLDGYISLTEGLNDMFNEGNKPYMIMEGIVEDIESKATKNEKYGNYFFFGGALLERYGIYNLISAFNKLNKEDIKLIICGHHGDERKLKESFNGNPNIVYLKMLPVKEVLNFEAGALANINPRPYSQDLDKFSIPSKTIEYYTSGRLTISAKSTILENHFKNCTIWCNYAKEDELLLAMQKALKMDEDKRIKMGIEAKEKAKELYSLTSINKKLDEFLIQFIK